MADLTFRRNRKAMMLHGSGESSIPAHAKRGDDPWGGRVEGSSQCRSRRSRKRFVMIPFGYNADRASLHWNNWSY